MAFTTNQDVRIHYQVEGDGPPLVIQHGFFWSVQELFREGYVDALKSHYRLIMVDARGHGDSDKPHDGAAYTLPLYVGDIAAVMDALEIPTAHYWGYSMGGWIGYGMVKYAPEKVRSMIIGGQHPYGRQLTKSSATDGTNPKAFLANFFEPAGIDFATFSSERQASFYDNDFLALAAAWQDRPNIEEVLPSMTMPCLIYVGEKDDNFQSMQKCVERIPDTTLLSFAGLNHPDTFFRSDVALPHILKFLAKVA